MLKLSSRDAHDQRVLWDRDPNVFRRSRATALHARYGEFEGTIKIEDLAVLEGHLPTRALELVKAWAAAHQVELAADCKHCREKRMPAKIDPLV